jgi:hypothetical protein
MYQARLNSNDNVADGNDDLDDNGNWIDQRVRMYFSFIASERLQLVTQWEADTLWGNETPGAGRHGGGDVGADATNLEMKNVYIDFLIPNTPIRSTVGVQALALLTGWIVDDDFSGAVFTTEFEPFTFKAGYLAAQNENVTDTSENIDDLFISMDYVNGPFNAALIGFYQYGHDTDVSVAFVESGTPFQDSTFPVGDNQLFDLGLNLGYKTDLFGLFFNGVKNFGSYDSPLTGGDVDYEGWMVEAGANLFVSNFTFTLSGFYTSGDKDLNDDSDKMFVAPLGRSHYWSEIMGLGTFSDVNVGDAGESDRVVANGEYGAADYPSNLWTVSVGAAWQALEGTKLTLNYYYIGTAKNVLADFTTGETDDTIGHELDFYLDQDVVDGMTLRLGAAYLWADDAYTVFADDDNAYELGAQLLWTF